MRQDETPRDMTMIESGMKRGDIAEALNISTRTVDRWIASGRLAFCRLPSGKRRIPSREVLRILTPTGAKLEGSK